MPLFCVCFLAWRGESQLCNSVPEEMILRYCAARMPCKPDSLRQMLDFFLGSNYMSANLLAYLTLSFLEDPQIEETNQPTN